MLFSYIDNNRCLNGNLKAHTQHIEFTSERKEQVFDLSGALSKASMVNEMSSVAFDYLEVSIGIRSKNLLYPEGYFPRATWIKKTLPGIEIVQGSVTLTTNVELLPGRLKHFEGSEDWKTYYDETTHWIYFGPDDIQVGHVNVEFAENVVASITDNQIVSLWLHPVNLWMSFPARLKALIRDRFGLQWGK